MTAVGVQVQQPRHPETDLARDLATDLHDAFLGEVRERLPRLQDGTVGVEVLRDVHTLGSSAWVVGEPDICRLARAAESDLGPVTLAPLVEALSDLLERSA